MEILAGINGAHGPAAGADMPPFKIVFDYVAPTMDPIVSDAGAASVTINPTKTFAEVSATGQQFDIIWVPAGWLGSRFFPSAETTISKVPGPAVLR
jgi:hypothetical protein